MKKSDRPKQMGEKEKLFETALGIQAPWYVRDIACDTTTHVLTVSLDFTLGSRFSHPYVEGLHPVQDTVTERYQYPNFFRFYDCYLEIRIPRIKLPDGSIQQIDPSIFDGTHDPHELMGFDGDEDEEKFLREEFERHEKDFEVKKEDFEKEIRDSKLPRGWEELDYIEKLRMFHMLFLLLNDDFQKKFGEELREWFKLFKMLEKGLRIDHFWAFGSGSGIVNIRCRHCPSFDGNSCEMIFSPAELYSLTYNKCFPSCDCFFSEELDIFPHRKPTMKGTSVWEPDILKELFLGSLSLEKWEKIKINEGKEAFEEYLEARIRNEIPKKIFFCVDLTGTPEKIMKDFEQKITRLQKPFLEQNPQYKTKEFGHLHKKIGSPDFRLKEFKNGFTVDRLCEALKKEGFDLKKNGIRALNNLLTCPELYKQLLCKRLINPIFR